MHNDKEVPEGLLVCHKCNNRLCVNPDHLYVGTYSDNMIDAINSGVRDKIDHLRGDDIETAKLTEKDIPTIVELYKGGLSHKKIAELFGVGSCTIGMVLRGESWKHIEREVIRNFTREKSRNPKLEAEDVKKIRRLANEGLNGKEISKRFNVSPSTIYDIVNFRTWVNV